MMLLETFYRIYRATHETGLRDSTEVYFYLPAIADLSRFLERPVNVADLTIDNVNAWLSDRLASKLSSDTVSIRKRAIMTLWKAAKRMKYTDVSPEEIKRLPKTKRVVVAWTKNEVATLFETIKEIPSEAVIGHNGLPKQIFFESLCMAGYETGLRLGDLMSIERNDLRTERDGKGYICTIQSKTQIEKASKLSKELMLMIDKLMAAQSERRIIWPDSNRRRFYEEFNEIVRGSGIRKGTFRWLRKSSTTHVEAEHPGCGYRHAGHADPRTSYSHYIDRSQLTESIYSPSPIIVRKHRVKTMIVALLNLIMFLRWK